MLIKKILLRIIDWVNQLRGLRQFYLKRRELKNRIFIDDSCNKSSRIFIMGNGPSFKNELSIFEQEMLKADMMAVNGFSLSDDFERLQPSCYIIIDPNFVREDNPVTSKMLAAIRDKTKWPMKLYMGCDRVSVLRFSNFFANHPYVTLSPISLLSVEGGKDFCHRQYKSQRAMPRPQNVLNAALMVAVHRKYKQIYLMGADHSWLNNLMVNQQNQLCVKDVHFYDAKHQEVTYTPLKDSQGNPYTIVSELQSFMYAFEAYYKIRDYVKEQQLDVQIYNLTKQSFIDVFEKPDYLISY